MGSEVAVEVGPVLGVGGRIVAVEVGWGEEELEWICSQGGEGRRADVVAEARGVVGGRRKGRTGRRPWDLGEAGSGIGDGSEVGAEREELAARS